MYIFDIHNPFKDKTKMEIKKTTKREQESELTEQQEQECKTICAHVAHIFDIDKDNIEMKKTIYNDVPDKNPEVVICRIKCDNYTCVIYVNYDGDSLVSFYVEFI